MPFGAALRLLRLVGAVGFLVLIALARPTVFQIFQLVVDGFVLGVILPVLYQLLQFFHALLGSFHSLPD